MSMYNWFVRERTSGDFKYSFSYGIAKCFVADVSFIALAALLFVFSRSPIPILVSALVPTFSLSEQSLQYFNQRDDCIWCHRVFVYVSNESEIPSILIMEMRNGVTEEGRRRAEGWLREMSTSENQQKSSLKQNHWILNLLWFRPCSHAFSLVPILAQPCTRLQ